MSEPTTATEGAARTAAVARCSCNKSGCWHDIVRHAFEHEGWRPSEYVADLRTRLEEAERELKETQATFDESQAYLAKELTRAETAEAKCRELEKQLDTARLVLDMHRELDPCSLPALDQQNAELRAKLSAAEAKARELEAELQDLHEDVGGLQHHFAAVCQYRAEAEARAQRAEEALRSLVEAVAPAVAIFSRDPIVSPETRADLARAEALILGPARAALAETEVSDE